MELQKQHVSILLFILLAQIYRRVFRRVTGLDELLE